MGSCLRKCGASSGKRTPREGGAFISVAAVQGKLRERHDLRGVPVFCVTEAKLAGTVTSPGVYGSI